MRAVAEIDADIAAALEARRPTVTRGRTDWRPAERADARLRALHAERDRAVAAARQIPMREPRGVTAEQAAGAGEVNVGGVWKPIVAHNRKSVSVVWNAGGGRTERETIPHTSLYPSDLRTVADEVAS